MEVNNVPMSGHYLEEIFSYKKSNSKMQQYPDLSIHEMNRNIRLPSLGVVSLNLLQFQSKVSELSCRVITHVSFYAKCTCSDLIPGDNQNSNHSSRLYSPGFVVVALYAAQPTPHQPSFVTFFSMCEN